MELETADQSSRVGKFNHRKKAVITMANVNGGHEHLGGDRLAIIVLVVDSFGKDDTLAFYVMERTCVRR